MQELFGFPYFEVQFGKDGSVRDEQEVAAAAEFLSQGPVTDLIVIVHGWNNDIDDAQRTYRSFFERVRAVLQGGNAPKLEGRSLGVLAVLWPSKKFADRELIAGGAASAAGPVSDQAVREHLETLKAVFEDPAAAAILESAKALVPKLEDSQAARKEFADLIRSLLSTRAADEEDASTELFALGGNDLMDRLSKPILFPDGVPGSSPQSGAASIGLAGAGVEEAGGAAGLGQFFAGVKGGAGNLLDFATYYEMKDRSGIVGQRGLSEVLTKLRSRRPDLKLHLVGHSFGGRLVTSTAATIPGPPVESMTLLQAAFSHNGFAHRFMGDKDGFFRNVITAGRVSGPLLITCSRNDKAVGVAYPLASRIAGQVASGLGDRNDIYGGMGRNGAQKTPEAIDTSLLPLGKTYELTPQRVYNLNADTFIMDHSDICKDEVAAALLAAVAST